MFRKLIHSDQNTCLCWKDAEISQFYQKHCIGSIIDAFLNITFKCSAPEKIKNINILMTYANAAVK